MESNSNERKIIMALEAFKKNPKLTIRAARKIYEILHTTLMKQHAGKQSQNNIPINSKKLTNLEKKIILDCIIKLVNQGFLLKQKNVQNIINFLCNTQSTFYIGP